MAELADASDLKSGGHDLPVPVRARLPAPLNIKVLIIESLFSFQE